MKKKRTDRNGGIYFSDYSNNNKRSYINVEYEENDGSDKSAIHLLCICKYSFKSKFRLPTQMRDGAYEWHLKSNDFLPYKFHMDGIN